MFNQYFYSDSDKYQTSEQLHPQIKPFAEEYPYDTSRYGYDKRSDTDSPKRIR